MSERQSPKQELIETLVAMNKILGDQSAPDRVRMAQLGGLLEHAQRLALNVGEASRPKKKKGVPAL